MTSRPSTQRARLTLIFDQVFSDQELIAPKQYLTVNLVAGLILVLWGLALVLEPARRSPATVALLVSGGLLVGLVLLGMARNELVGRSLLVQGAIVSALGVFLAVDTIQWAVTAPPHAMFRYMPGAIAIAITYGVLQIAAFGTRRPLTSTVRIAGLISGGLLELVAAGFVVVRALN
jgi:hypothetical protein